MRPKKKQKKMPACHLQFSKAVLRWAGADCAAGYHASDRSSRFGRFAEDADADAGTEGSGGLPVEEVEGGEGESEGKESGGRGERLSGRNSEIL